MPMPKVAIVGRSNVGKSTLFNTIGEKNRALTSPEAGTTRDRLEAPVLWRGMQFTLVDTGGSDPAKNDPYAKKIIQQALVAEQEADLLIALADVTVGPINEDIELIKRLRKQGKPFLVAINKCDNPARRARAGAFKRVGKEYYPISATSGSGIGDLLDEIVKRIAPTHEAKSVEEKPAATLALIGKPNVGKSSLANSIAGSERMIVSPIPHTTRDAQDIEVATSQGTAYRIIDTAGVRRRDNRGDEVEELSIGKTRLAAKRADVVALVIDISEPFTAQDKRLGREMEDYGKGLLIVANKWDLVAEKTSYTIEEYEARIASYFPNLPWAPIVFVSALENQRTKRLLELALDIKNNLERTVTDNALSNFVKKAASARKPTIGKGTRRPRILSMRQTGINPPSFQLDIPLKTNLARSYRQYLANALRKEFNFEGVPLSVSVREREPEQNEVDESTPKRPKRKRVTHRRRNMGKP